MQVWDPKSLSLEQWETIRKQPFPGFLLAIRNQKSLLLPRPSSSKRTGRSHKLILAQKFQDSARGEKGHMA